MVGLPVTLRLGGATSQEGMDNEERDAWRAARMANRYGHEGKRVIGIDGFAHQQLRQDMNRSSFSIMARAQQQSIGNSQRGDG